MSELEQKLAKLYAADKASQALPEELKKALQQPVSLRQAGPSSQSWWAAAASVVAMLALAYVWHGSTFYQIQPEQQLGYMQVELHQLSPQDAQPKTAWSQRYTEYQQAKLQLDQQQALLGQLQQEHEQWQIAVCDQLLVKLAPELAVELQQQQQWQVGQAVELIRGQQGQILAVKQSLKLPQCQAG